MTSPLPDSFFAQPSPAAAAGAASSSPSKPRLTLDDITHLFSLPITEAASILGVSTSVLKRLCRKNGIARWPYRQLLSGKTIEDIKKEAEIEKSKIQKEREEMGKRKTDASKASLATTMGPLKMIGDHNHRIAPGQALQQGNRIMSPNLDPFSLIRNVPTYLDEFKFGFPSTGLSSASNKWWGSDKSSPEQSSVEESETPKKPYEILVSLRKRAVEETRDFINGEAKKDLESCKLNKRQKLVLMQVFGSSLPDQWKNVVA